MNIKQLRKLVMETVREEQAKRPRSQRRARTQRSQLSETLRYAKLLIEAEEEGQDEEAEQPSNEGSVSIGHEVNTGNSTAVDKILDLLFDKPAEFRALYANLPPTGKDKEGKDKFAWYGGKLGKMSDEELGKLRDAIFNSKQDALDGFDRINEKLKAGKGFSKAYMPAFEGVDVQIVADALNSSQGDLGVDFEKPWNKTHDFEEYMQDDEVQEKLKENRIISRWNRLAGLLVENGFKATEDMPFPGPAKTMPGAPAVGNDDKKVPTADQVSGTAKGYLTKGTEEMGGDGSDVMTVDANTSISHNDMVPTQREVKLLKTLAFALLDVGQDMGGAFVDNEGNILDGHHRWSGQELRGFTGQHTQVHQINRAGKFSGKGSTPRFLKLLSTISAAIGRPTKLK